MLKLFTRKCRHSGQYYTNRFGDVVCDKCQAPIGWHFAFVRDGVFGDATLEWARKQYHSYVQTDEGRAYLEVGERHVKEMYPS